MCTPIVYQDLSLCFLWGSGPARIDRTLGVLGVYLYYVGSVTFKILALSLGATRHKTKQTP